VKGSKSICIGAWHVVFNTYERTAHDI